MFQPRSELHIFGEAVPPGDPFVAHVADVLLEAGLDEPAVNDLLEKAVDAINAGDYLDSFQDLIDFSAHKLVPLLEEVGLEAPRAREVGEQLIVDTAAADGILPEDYLSTLDEEELEALNDRAVALDAAFAEFDERQVPDAPEPGEHMADGEETANRDGDTDMPASKIDPHKALELQKRTGEVAAMEEGPEKDLANRDLERDYEQLYGTAAAGTSIPMENLIEGEDDDGNGSDD